MDDDTATTDSTPTEESTDEVTEPPADEPSASAGPVTVLKSGIGPSADGDFTSWGVVLGNTGGDVALVDVAVTGLNKSGDAVGTASATLFRAPTGESYVGGVFLEKGIKSIEVDVSGETAYEETSAPISGELSGTLTITGHSYDAIVSAKVKSTLDVATKDGMPFYIVYFDSAGKVVGGAGGFTPGAFQPGRTRQVALQQSMSSPPADRFAKAKVFFDVSDSSMKAS